MPDFHACWCRAEFPEANIEVAKLDLSDLKSVRAYGKLAQEQGQPLDVLLNNAGSSLVCSSMVLLLRDKLNARLEEGFVMFESQQFLMQVSWLARRPEPARGMKCSWQQIT